MRQLVISIDVGGTKTLVGAADQTGALIREWTQNTREPGVDHVGRAVEFARACAAELTSDGVDTTIAAVAAGFPEYVTAEGELASDEVLEWSEQPVAALAAAFEDLGGPPIVVESDVRLGALGEAVLGAGIGAESMVYISLGTGLSSAIVLGGEVWPGARGEAIAFGEHRVHGTASDTTLEQYCSGSAIEARYGELTGRHLVGRKIAELARNGEREASEVLESAGTELGHAVAELVDVLDPHLVVIGGGLGAADTPLRRSAFSAYSERTERRPDAARFRPAECGHRSGLLGGAAAAWRIVSRAGAPETPRIDGSASFLRRTGSHTR